MQPHLEFCKHFLVPHCENNNATEERRNRDSVKQRTAHVTCNCYGQSIEIDRTFLSKLKKKVTLVN